MELMKANIQTMSSREIAEVTGKDHKNVKRDILSMLDSLSVDKLSFERTYLDKQNRKQTMYLLDKEYTLALVTGYNVAFRMAVIKRWQELENQQPALPDFSDPVAAARAWADAKESEQKALSDLEEAKPKIEYHDKVLATENGITTTEVASELGLSAIKLNRILESMKIQRKIGNRWVLTAANLDKGYAVESTFVDDGGKSRHSLKWTEKGRKFINELVEGV